VGTITSPITGNPLIDILLGVGGLAGTYFASKKSAVKEVNQSRDMARVMRHEPVSVPPSPGATS
jgi:hypothetical protein